MTRQIRLLIRYFNYMSTLILLILKNLDEILTSASSNELQEVMNGQTLLVKSLKTSILGHFFHLPFYYYPNFTNLPERSLHAIRPSYNYIRESILPEGFTRETNKKNISLVISQLFNYISSFCMWGQEFLNKLVISVLEFLNSKHRVS